MTKFNMEKAWEGALSLIRANMGLLWVLAGLFFFLPSLGGSMMLPAELTTTGSESPEEMLAIMSGYFRDAGPIMLGMSLIGAVGTLGMIVLFTDRSRPTVQDALKIGLTRVIPYLLVSVLAFVGLFFAAMLLVGIPQAVGASIMLALTLPLLFALAAYVMVKISLASAVIVAENQINPILAFRRSWMVTKGNSLRLFLFYMLLVVPYVILIALMGGLFGMVGNVVAGETGQLFASSAASSVLAGAWGTLSAAITASIYGQLSGRADRDVSETFG